MKNSNRIPRSMDTGIDDNNIYYMIVYFHYMSFTTST